MLLGIYDDLLMSGSQAAAIAAGGRFYFGGFNIVKNNPAQIISSIDLLNWQQLNTPIRGYVSGIAVGNELMAATGLDFGAAYGPLWQGAIITSKDSGQTWTYRLSDPSAATWGCGGLLAFGKGVFVNVSFVSGGNTLWTSSDLVNWTQRAMPFYGGVASMQYVNGHFFMCGYDSTNRKPVYAVSSDGVSWVRGADVFTGTASGVNAVTYINGTYVLEANPNGAPELAFSKDLANWTRSQLPFPGGSASNLVYGFVTYFKGQYWATGASSTASDAYWASSTDLVNWTVRNPAGGNVGATGRPFVAAGKLVATYVQGGSTASNSATSSTGIVGNTNGFVYAAPGAFGLLQSNDGASFSPVAIPAAIYQVTSAITPP